MVIARFASVIARVAVALAFLLIGFPVRALEVKLVTLVQARTPQWRSIPDEALIAGARLSYKNRVFLESSGGMTVRAPEVRKALREALEAVPAGERDRLGRVLEAIRGWAGANLEVAPSSLSCPASWRDAAELLREKRGNRFEIVRALAAILRAAGVPARPTFNGEPVIYLYVTGSRGGGFWTVWDACQWNSASASLPVLWLPLRAEEVQPVWSDSDGVCPDLALQGRRFLSREEAQSAFLEVKETGVFPASEREEDKVEQDRGSWWEVWAIGARLEPEPSQAFDLFFPVPFVKELEYGMREHAFWVSDPRRLGRISRINARTDQVLGGLTLTVRVSLVPAPAGAGEEGG